MVLLVFVAIAGGLAAGAAVAPFGLLAALLAAPMGGSLCAVVAALVLMRLRGPAVPSDVDLDAQTDAMVADLRGVAAQARSQDAAPSERRSTGRHVA